MNQLTLSPRDSLSALEETFDDVVNTVEDAYHWLVKKFDVCGDDGEVLPPTEIERSIQLSIANLVRPEQFFQIRIEDFTDEMSRIHDYLDRGRTLRISECRHKGFQQWVAERHTPKWLVWASYDTDIHKQVLQKMKSEMVVEPWETADIPEYYVDTLILFDDDRVKEDWVKFYEKVGCLTMTSDFKIIIFYLN